MPQNMSSGELCKMIFVRQFRFILKGRSLSSWLTKSVEIDYTSKKIKVRLYETFVDGVIPAHVWADSPDEELEFITFDCSGNELYRRIFSGLKILQRKNVFDYSDSDVACHQIILGYQQCSCPPVTPQIHQTQEKEGVVDHLHSRIFIK